MAVFVAVLLGASNGAVWALPPIVGWFFSYIAIRNWAAQNPPDARLQTPPPRQRETLGKDGVDLLQKADAAVATIMSSTAVRDGWLGPVEQIDFHKDLQLIEDRVRRVVGIREVITEVSLLPEPSEDDRKRKVEAKQAESKLLKDAQDRVKRLEVLAREVQATDRELRLRALTDLGDEGGVESTETVDSTRAMLKAYREVKGLTDLEPREIPIPGTSQESENQQVNTSGFLDSLKKWWSN